MKITLRLIVSLIVVVVAVALLSAWYQVRQQNQRHLQGLVERTIESRIDWEHFSVQKEGHIPLVKPFPISVDFTQPDREARQLPEKPDQASVLKDLGIKAEKIADTCLVTSLHDGMNLVAKEFVAASDDHRGVLILSRFAGASRDLKDALIVNPYDIEQMADAIYYSLVMPKAEVEERMTRMRQEIHENNIHKWAANLTEELMKLRMDSFTGV